ncbi:unnamed protein product [Blepharisma stoltei]|uniref:Ribosomal protein S10 n=1 Tax=Blepharisma stoltei TaxID=1481888 RepID=A0AAU9KCQ9_9CILI|nr:unnamed protein product [Blepharisma stoltei]
MKQNNIPALVRHHKERAQSSFIKTPRKRETLKLINKWQQIHNCDLAILASPIFKAFPKRVSTPSFVHSYRTNSPINNPRLLRSSVKDQGYSEIKSAFLQAPNNSEIKRIQSEEVKIVSSGRYLTPKRTSRDMSDSLISSTPSPSDNSKSIAYYSFRVFGNDENFKEGLDKILLKVKPSKLYFKRYSNRE